MTTNWNMIEKGRWSYSDGTNTAETHKVREGIIHSSEWMWTTTLNGEWLTNADSLADARQAVAEALSK
jgi:hypothetical protein